MIHNDNDNDILYKDTRSWNKRKEKTYELYGIKNKCNNDDILYTMKYDGFHGINY